MRKPQKSMHPVYTVIGMFCFLFWLWAVICFIGLFAPGNCYDTPCYAHVTVTPSPQAEPYFPAAETK